jgi:hypothetical protein
MSNIPPMGATNPTHNYVIAYLLAALFYIIYYNNINKLPNQELIEDLKYC